MSWGGKGCPLNLPFKASSGPHHMKIQGGPGGFRFIIFLMGTLN
jgi:hypothetical protein